MFLVSGFLNWVVKDSLKRHNQLVTNSIDSCIDNFVFTLNLEKKWNFSTLMESEDLFFCFHLQFWTKKGIMNIELGFCFCLCRQKEA